MRALASKVRDHAFGLAFPRVFPPDSRRQDLIRLGTQYGGWWVPSSLLDSRSICYCAGVGTDISFDLGLIARFDCSVWAFDPTPRSVAWVGSQDHLDPRFTFLPVGLAAQDSSFRFYAPRDSSWVSHSLTNLQKTDSYFDAPCNSLATLLDTLGHSHIDLLKLDIEGAEHMVLESMLSDFILPKVLCVEFDQPEPLRVTRKTVRRLKANGYALVNVEWFNMTFVYEG